MHSSHGSIHVWRCGCSRYRTQRSWRGLEGVNSTATRQAPSEVAQIGFIHRWGRDGCLSFSSFPSDATSWYLSAYVLR